MHGIPLARTAALITFLLLPPVPGRTATARDAQALAQDYGCLACHGLVHKQVGPGFAQIADRYRGDPAMPALLAQKIRSGSVGTWGRVIMPRQPRVTQEDARVLAEWVLGQTGGK